VLTEAYDSYFFKSSLYFSHAYAPVFHSIKELLTGEDEYGINIVRNGDSLSKSSELYISDVVLEVVAHLSKEEFDVAVDLGCGSGHIGKRISAILDKTCIGVDNFSDTYRSDSSAHSQEYRFLQGNIKHPFPWCDQLPSGRKIFVASMVLHEFLYGNTETLCTFFADYSKAFPSALMYILEWLFT
jgi:hypothetical protein